MLKMDYANILRRAKRAHPTSILEILEYCNTAMGGFGVEITRSVDDTQYEFFGLEYVNMGDTCNQTILYDYRRGQFRITSWVDIVEADMKRFE